MIRLLKKVKEILKKFRAFFKGELVLVSLDEISEKLTFICDLRSELEKVFNGDNDKTELISEYKDELERLNNKVYELEKLNYILERDVERLKKELGNK